MYKIILNTFILLTPLYVSGQTSTQDTAAGATNTENQVAVAPTPETSSPDNAQVKEEILTQEGRASYRRQFAELKTQIQEIHDRLDKAFFEAIRSDTPLTLQQHAEVTAQHREKHFDDYVKLEELQDQARAIGLVLNTDLLHYNNLADDDSVKIARERIESLKNNTPTKNKIAAEEKINALILKDSYNASIE